MQSDQMKRFYACNSDSSAFSPKLRDGARIQSTTSRKMVARGLNQNQTDLTVSESFRVTVPMHSAVCAPAIWGEILGFYGLGLGF